MAAGSTQSPIKAPLQPDDLPGHQELPEQNGEFAQSFRELPQSILHSQSLWPILRTLHPDKQFAIGHDCRIYWRLTDPLEGGAVCPDWFYVAGVPPDLEGHYRRSYVLWKEFIAPSVILEFASDHGEFERDATPLEGKYWNYEKAVHGGYYGIFVVETGDLEVYRLEGDRYRKLAPNAGGRYFIEPLDVELGVWQGEFFNIDTPWLRWFDRKGNLLPMGEELAVQEHRRAEEAIRRAEEECKRAEEEHKRAEEERKRAEEESQRAEEESQRAERLVAKLRELGVDPSAI
jgi:Uma2 family endonuclease